MEIWDSQGLHPRSYSSRWQRWNSNSGLLAPDCVLWVITLPPIVTVKDWLQDKSQHSEQGDGVIILVIGFVLSGTFWLWVSCSFHCSFMHSTNIELRTLMGEALSCRYDIDWIRPERLLPSYSFYSGWGRPAWTGEQIDLYQGDSLRDL